MLCITDLVVRYGDNVAVDRLSLRVPKGSFYGLLGPNGAGKTTTIAAVAGLVQPAEGDIRVAGFDPATQPTEVRRRLGLVPQDLALYPTLTVGDNLAIFGGLFGLGGGKLRERVAWGLALAQLEERARARVADLSGGMKRRLNLACALLHDPALIICDEPTAGVDPQSRSHLFDTLRQLHADGRTIVYTTHYMEEVEALCERVAIIDHGRLIADASLEALLAAPPRAARFSLSLGQATDAETVANVLASAGLAVDSVTAPPRSLEQVFLELTGHALRDGS